MQYASIVDKIENNPKSLVTICKNKNVRETPEGVRLLGKHRVTYEYEYGE